jgi:hypothetical protein
MATDRAPVHAVAPVVADAERAVRGRA